MRVIFIFLLALVTTTQAQQINPVPDYIFRNQMSVGRNAATDSMAYFSVGPKYGAVKGMMPPMVTDTASVTVPGTARTYELRFGVSGSTASHYATLHNAALKIGS